jgi:hypothetical protein
MDSTETKDDVQTAELSGETSSKTDLNRGLEKVDSDKSTYAVHTPNEYWYFQVKFKKTAQHTDSKCQARSKYLQEQYDRKKDSDSGDEAEHIKKTLPKRKVNLSKMFEDCSNKLKEELNALDKLNCRGIFRILHDANDHNDPAKGAFSEWTIRARLTIVKVR